MNRFLIPVSLLFLALFLASAVPAHASGITDPNIGLDEPPNCETGLQVFGAFTFSSNSTGGGFACFQNGNADSLTVTSVDIETFGNFGNDNCGGADTSIVGFSNAFDLCSVTYNAAANVTDIFFSESPSILSIAPGQVFEVDLNNAQSCSPQLSNTGTGTCTDSGVDNTGGWAPNSVFAGETNLLARPTTPFLTTPEPSTVSLLAVGMLGMLGLLTVKNKNKKKSSEVLRAL
jgi:hypothetical protein